CESFTDFTMPISTDLWRIFVLPASMPSALSNWIVTVGPFSSTCLTAIHPPTSRALTGMIQTKGDERLPGSLAYACGISSLCGAGFSSLMAFVERIPDEARVEAHGGEHGEHHDGAERDGARPGLDVGEGPQVHERDERAAHVDVGHGPAADPVRR